MTNKLNREIINYMFEVIKTVKHKMFLCSESANITPVQFGAMYYIYSKKIVSMSQISEYFSTTMPTATSLIDKLIMAKLVVRKHDSKDRRIINISLTTQGEKVLKEAAKNRTNSMNKMLSYLSQVEKEQLLKIFKKIVDRQKTNEK